VHCFAGVTRFTSQCLSVCLLCVCKHDLQQSEQEACGTSDIAPFTDQESIPDTEEDTKESIRDPEEEAFVAMVRAMALDEYKVCLIGTLRMLDPSVIQLT
jgi:hypothetical protein